MSKKPTTPTGLELLILQVLWERGPSTVREVLTNLRDDKERAYTTILSTMQVMEKKNLLKRTGTVSGAIVFGAAVKQEKVSGSALRDFMKAVFDGNPTAVVQHLLSEELVSDDELREIRSMLDAHSRSSADGETGQQKAKTIAPSTRKKP